MHAHEPGRKLPKRGNRFSRAFGRMCLRVFGWRIEGELPDVSKCVAIAAPHTSNWDFYFGIGAMLAVGVRVNWIGKHTIFRWPFGGFMRWLGGTPVTRVSGEGVVREVVAAMKGLDRYVFGLSPEGTRKRVERWRTGFNHVAREAGVPILLTYFDYARHRFGIGPLFDPTGDVESDLSVIQQFYRDKTPRYAAGF